MVLNYQNKKLPILQILLDRIIEKKEINRIKNKKKLKPLRLVLRGFGVPGGTRTPGLQVRSLPFYPAKLQVHTYLLYMYLIKYSIEINKNVKKNLQTLKKCDIIYKRLEINC